MDKKLTHKAVVALLKHHEETTTTGIKEKQKIPLLGTDVAVQLQFCLEVAPQQMKVKPIRLSLPHSIYKLTDMDDDAGKGDSINHLDDAEICLIVKDESKEMVLEMIQQFPQYMKNIKKVLTLQSLRTKHSEYRKRRELLAAFTLFLADDRILPMLTSALGKDFLKAKKQPIPVRITRREALPFAIRRAIVGATYLHIPDGTCVTVRAGYSSQNVDHLVNNISAIIEQVPPKMPRKWANVRSVSVKLPNSVALPIYNKTPEELIQIAEMAGLSSMWNDSKPLNSKQSEMVSRRISTEEQNDEGFPTVQSSAQTATKSPLLKALEKQTKKEKSTIVSNNADNKALPPSKKKRKQEPNEKSMNETVDCTNRKVEQSSPSKKVKLSESRKALAKETMALAPSDASLSTDSKPSFIPSKKFIGTKTGYVFHTGNRGLGYYVDHPPVVDKVALSKLIRSGAKNSGRSGKKRRGK